MQKWVKLTHPFRNQGSDCPCRNSDQQRTRQDSCRAGNVCVIWLLVIHVGPVCKKSCLIFHSWFYMLKHHKHHCFSFCVWLLYYLESLWASLVTQMAKNPPAMLQTQIQSLSQEDSLEKGMATHSSIPVWRIPWTEEPGKLQSTGSQRVRHDWATNTTYLYCSCHFSSRWILSISLKIYVEILVGTMLNM